MTNPPSPEKPTVDWVTEDIIREHFNKRQFFNKALSGEFSTFTTRDSHLDPPPEGEPYCTRSQIVYYYDPESNPVAVVHQYRRPDGSIGASGQPDPKKIILEDRIIAVRTQPPESE